LAVNRSMPRPRPARARLFHGQAGRGQLTGGAPPIMRQIERHHVEYEFAYPADPWHIPI